MKELKLKTKSQIAYDMIREMILNGTALPGSRLILMDLEEKLGAGIWKPRTCADDVNFTCGCQSTTRFESLLSRLCTART